MPLGMVSKRCGLPASAAHYKASTNGRQLTESEIARSCCVLHIACCTVHVVELVHHWSHGPLRRPSIVLDAKRCCSGAIIFRTIQINVGFDRRRHENCIKLALNLNTAAQLLQEIDQRLSLLVQGLVKARSDAVDGDGAASRQTTCIPWTSELQAAVVTQSSLNSLIPATKFQLDASH